MFSDVSLYFIRVHRTFNVNVDCNYDLLPELLLYKVSIYQVHLINILVQEKKGDNGAVIMTANS